MNPQEMEQRIYVLTELLDRWMLSFGRGCENTTDDEEPDDDCPCIYCTTIRTLDEA
jgi:hypothetical protein